MKFRNIKLATTALLLTTSLSAFDFSMSVGVHDFVVSDIINDTPADGIHAGTSHTVGVNTAIYAKHTTTTGINILAKAEAFLDYDRDHLDPDHIPIWFDFLIDIDGIVNKFNDNHSIKWYILMDNRQNTVSCVEREVRQHMGVGYQFTQGKFLVDLNLYGGFYYIEIDDDTPVARGYTREQTDDGEASNIVELTMNYDFTKHFSLKADARRYAANTGGALLEQNYELHALYKNDTILFDGVTLNFKVKYAKYDLDRFHVDNSATEGRDILPFDNDMLIQAYATIPLNY